MTGLGKAAGLVARSAWLWRNRSAFFARPSGHTPRLLVDVSVIIRSDAATGIQRVVRAVWSELIRRSGPDFVVVPVFASHRAGYAYAPTDFLSSRVPAVGAEPVAAGPGDMFLGLDLAAHLLPKYREQICAWKQSGASLHVLVYDVLPLSRPEWFSPATVRHFRKWFDLLASEVDQAICISDKVVEDVKRQLQGRKGSRLLISRIPMGADINASVPSQGVDEHVATVLEQMRSQPTVLMVGTIEPRKGYDVALAAFEHLWRALPDQAPDLVIVGRGGWKTAALQERIRSHPEHLRRLHWIEGASDEALCLFYDACRCLLIASRDEGFGLPLIEASAHGRHILARDLPVFHEQGLPNASFFDDDRPEPLGARIMDVVASSKQSWVEAGELPTWSDCVDSLLGHIGLQENVGIAPAAALRKAS